jgi:hypothetical protein
MANRADTKLAILSLLLSMSDQDDLDRVFRHAMHLLRQRNRDNAHRHLALLQQLDEAN